MNGGVMTGYAMRVRQLDAETIAEYNIGLDLGEHDPRSCVAIFGEDLGECLAAVVDLGDEDNGPHLVWSDADGTGKPIADLPSNKDGNAGLAFAQATSLILKALFPHLSEDAPDPRRGIHHAHDAICLGANELNEVCCQFLDGDALRGADRWVVTFSDGHTINTFTSNADDAIALAQATGYAGDKPTAFKDPQVDPYA